MEEEPCCWKGCECRKEAVGSSSGCCSCPGCKEMKLCAGSCKNKLCGLCHKDWMLVCSICQKFACEDCSFEVAQGKENWLEEREDGAYWCNVMNSCNFCDKTYCWECKDVRHFECCDRSSCCKQPLEQRCSGSEFSETEPNGVWHCRMYLCGGDGCQTACSCG